MTDRTMKTIEIVCTNCGEPWEVDHAERCELRDGVWLEAQRTLKESDWSDDEPSVCDVCGRLSCDGRCGDRAEEPTDG